MEKEIILPKRCNYIGVFLTMRCNMDCSYCINRNGKNRAKYKEMSYQRWFKALKDIPTRPDLPITLQGGEPTLYPGFYRLVELLAHEGKHLDLLTNANFNVFEFWQQIDLNTFHRAAKYGSIRISYHKDHDSGSFINKVRTLRNMGFQITVFGLDRPDLKERNIKMEKMCNMYFIDFRLKEFLGKYRGKLYGTYRYPGALDGEPFSPCECRTSELLVAPDGQMYRCHSDLYNQRNTYGNITRKKKIEIPDFTYCGYFGDCNPCDVKLKTNRHQEFGHCSVEIREARGGEY